MSKALVVSALLLVSTLISAQPLVGTWVSDEPVLVHIKFSLTFRETEYVIDSTLGRTIGTYTWTADRIFFTPTSAGIDGGEVGAHNTWDYHLTDDSLTLISFPISVRLHRRP